MWLKATSGSAAGEAAVPRPPARFEIRQHHKRFDPHIVAVPAGSVVSFPNLDPFFHNVFSLYDGNRFDLGLYEAGATHSATFSRPGVSFIFCNIHPEMSAVVVVVDGPYYALSNAAGEISISNVPPGRYRVQAWHERAKPARSQTLPFDIEITRDSFVLPAIALVDSGELITPHKNKYGRDYPAPSPGVLYEK